jgi:hypothetical protein
MSGGRTDSSAAAILLGSSFSALACELDLLALLLLGGGDDLPDRFCLLGVEALVSPQDEVGGPGVERRRRKNRGENRSSAAHCHLPDRRDPTGAWSCALSWSAASA